RKHGNEFALPFRDRVLFLWRQHHLPHVTETSRLLDPRLHQIDQHLIEPESTAHLQGYAGKFLRLLLEHFRNVANQMQPGMQKIGNHQHLRRSKIDTLLKNLRKVGPEPRHETHVDELITVFFSKTSSDPLHILPGFRHPASMPQKNYSLARSGGFFFPFRSLTINHVILHPVWPKKTRTIIRKVRE